MPNTKKTQLASLLAICAGGLAAAAPAVAAGGKNQVGPGGLPTKLLLVYKHRDSVKYPTNFSAGPTTVNSTTKRSFALSARIPLTLSKQGTAKGSGALNYQYAHYAAHITTTTSGEDLYCKKHEDDVAIASTGSTATAAITVGPAKGKHKIGPIKLVFNPGRPAETVVIDDKVLEGASESCTSAGIYRREENHYLEGFQFEWGGLGKLNDLTGDVKITTIRPQPGALLSSGSLATFYPGRTYGTWKDEFRLLKR